LFDSIVFAMPRVQAIKALPHFGQCDGGNEKVCGVLGKMPIDQARVRLGFDHFADGVRVEHELHREIRFTESFGIRGGSQSVVNRMESYQDLIFFIEGRVA
jgi:hypothetical protein